jgi:para-aminobenzoate synthetase component 1
MNPSLFSGQSIPFRDLRELKDRLLSVSRRFPYAMMLDNCESGVDRYGRFELLLGLGGSGCRRITDWDALKRFATLEDSWLMGAFPYELKNLLEPSLSTLAPESIAFPETAIFVPEIVIAVERDSAEVRFLGDGAEELIRNLPPPDFQEKIGKSPQFQSNFSRAEYIETIHRLREHIREGDFYEFNLSQSYFADFRLADPAGLFRKLISLSPVPFAAFLQFGSKALICASPERFLQLHNGQLLSQPIKGTAARGKTASIDRRNMKRLRLSVKEQAENVMIVDLTRNDLHRACRPHTVEVPHLFDIQTFPQLHQMVSTVTGRKAAHLNWLQAFSRIFPPGSMTGAPKVKVMEMIDRYEPNARGIYAGSAGYVSPGGDFDLNVIIRSLVYDDVAEKLSYHVGGAITYDSDPEKEFEETLVKAKGIRALFGGS